MGQTYASRMALLLHSLGIAADYGATRGLKLQREAGRLVHSGKTPDGRAIRLSPRAASAWKRMQAAAARDGIELLPVSGFRSVRRQTKIIRAKLAAGRTLATILRVNAAPGYSEHHTGRALDIGTPGHVALDGRFARTSAFRWLGRHAKKFGFHLSYPRNSPSGIVYEPWHWCWRA